MNKAYFQNYVKLFAPKRKEIYPILLQAISREYGLQLTVEQLQKIIRAHRTLQELIPNDEVGQALERNWLANRGMATSFQLAQIREGKLF